MNLSKRRPSPNRSLVFPDQNSSDSQKRMGSQKESFDESDENSQPSLRESTARWEEPPSTKHVMSNIVSSASKKKILSERNPEASPDSHFAALLQNIPQVRSSGDRRLMVSSTSSNHTPYDPVTNYLSPRPQFLRYDPNRRREFIQRTEGTGPGDDESSSDNESSSTSSSLFQEEVMQEIAEDGSDSEDDDIEDEAEGERLRYSTVVCKLILLLGALVFLTCFISSMNSPTAHYLRESGGFLESHLIMGNHSMFYGNALESLVGSPEICLIVHPRELVSQDEGIEYKPLVLDDLINGEEPEGKESDPFDSDTPSTEEIKEVTEPSTVSEFEVKWELSRIWICSLTAVLGLLTALYKYFTRPRQSALLESPSFSDPTVEGKTSSAVLMNEEAESKGHKEGFSSVEATVLETRYQELERRVAEILRTPVQLGHSTDDREELYETPLPTAEVLRTPVLLRHSSDKHEELYASRPPTVELLGEFSFVDVKGSQTGSGQTERSGSKGSPLRQYERNRSKRKSPSASANKVLPSSPAESVSDGSFSARNESHKKEDTTDRQKIVATTTTPLRRSGRLRSRVTSP